MHVCENCGEIVMNDGPCPNCTDATTNLTEVLEEKPNEPSNDTMDQSGQIVMGCFGAIGYAVLTGFFTLIAISRGDALGVSLISVGIFIFIVTRVFRAGNKYFGSTMAIVGGILLLLITTCANIYASYG